MEAIIAIGAFAGLFVAWAVAPSFIRKRHSSKVEGEDSR